MKKVFLLKGLNCPNCSAKIEKEVGELEYVSLSEMNLMKQTLTVDFDRISAEKMLETVTAIVHNHESDVEVSEFVENEPVEDDRDRAKAKRLIVGSVFYLIGVLLTIFADVNFAIELGIFIVGYAILGADVVLKAVKNILKGHVFDENFLMSISTIGAFLIGEYPEAVAVMFFYQIGEMFQDMAVRRSRKSISQLMDIRPDTANVVRHGEIITVSPETIAVREIIMVKPGEKIPLDGIILDGESMLDTRALTGESVPKTVRTGDEVLSGCINENGVLTIRVTKSFGDSTASKIIDMVENASSRKAPTENFITKFARYYTPIVVIAAVLLAVLPPLILDGVWTEWIRRSLVFLVISCPCALVLSIPLTFFGGIGAASKRGVLVKGGNYLEALNNVGVIVFDKTGTLTKGVFNVTDIQSANGFTKKQILEYAAYAESYSNHPIAKSIINAFGGEMDKSSVSDLEEISGHGVKAVVNGKTVFAGNGKLMEAHGISFEESTRIGTKVYVSVNGKYAGCITIADEIKDDSKEAIRKLKGKGINKTVMLTGDNENIAKAVGEELGITEYYAQLLPNQKVEKLEQLDNEKRQNSKLVFVGDGINDAPVLARADVGIAMGGLGSDAAIEAADVVLMTDEPSKLVDAIQVAKATKRIVVQNIVIALGIKGLFLILGAFGIAGMWEAVFGDVGVAVIAILNAMRILKK